MRENAMRTTVTLDEKLVREVMKVTTGKTKTSAVTAALKEHVRRSRMDALRSMLGKVDLDPDGLKDLRELEMQETEAENG
jgi:Arc/MetJ family transcription regulator